MNISELQKALSQQKVNETKVITEIVEALKNLSSGNTSVEQVIKVYTENQMKIDDVIKKYLTGEIPPVVYVPIHGGYHLSLEHRKKISDSCKGRRMSEEEKERHRENSRRKEVYQYTKDWELVFQWNSTRDAERIGGYNNSNISRAARTGRLAYGYYWTYRPIGEPNEDITITTETIIKKG